MILTGNKIKQGVLNGDISIDPFDESMLNPNSYNFRVSDEIYVYEYEAEIDTAREPVVKRLKFPSSGLRLTPNQFYLACSKEIMGSNKYVPFIEGRSSIGRLGLFVHITAPLGDIGYLGKWTLQLRPTIPITIYPSQKIGQIMFFTTKGEVELYNGKYQGGTGPQYSRIHKDYESV